MGGEWLDKCNPIQVCYRLRKDVLVHTRTSIPMDFILHSIYSRFAFSLKSFRPFILSLFPLTLRNSASFYTVIFN